MRYLAILLATVIGWADVRFEVKESVSGHPLLVKKAGSRTKIIHFSGSKTATQENNFLTITDSEQDELILLDLKAKRYARARLKESRDHDRKTFFDALPVGVRMVVVEAGVADTWNGVAVERSVRTLSLPANVSGLPADAEFLITDFVSSELPGWASVMAKREGDDARWNQELSAMVSTMAVKDVQLFKDVLKVRSSTKTLSLPVRMIADFRLAPGPGQDGEEVKALSGGSLMRLEREMSGLNSETIDPDTFLVPADYQLIDMDDMLDAKYPRSGQ